MALEVLQVDSLCGARGESGESDAARRIKTEFLAQMDGVWLPRPGIASESLWSFRGLSSAPLKIKHYIVIILSQAFRIVVA